ncbi:hypothetical protein [Lysinibacillus endophyticus]|uniref:hypothetical protein n=1 Tax=Ureibacillus endophyticus TaxID=1978490 RepID=UPI00209FF916|nr:hypothetical protein [Lysinibacillus endophyticus]MCP1144980.1 hypothetical protein [Lysinibacillus endophyticus]
MKDKTQLKLARNGLHMPDEGQNIDENSENCLHKPGEEKNPAGIGKNDLQSVHVSKT